MSMLVKHKSYGEGTVRCIENGFIEIAFGETIKKFQFPKAFGPFLVTEDPDLLQKIEQAKAEEEKKKAEKTETVAKPTLSTESIKKNDMPAAYKPFNRSINSPLVGDRAQNISVRSENEMFELVGYMATPGRVSSIEAEVPRDGRDETFEKMFPGQTYRPIETGYTPSGMPNKLSPQFRINFANLENCPDTLRNNMGKGNGSCVGRINKSKFVIEIVQNYGFKFGDRQDIAAIRAIAEKKGHLEAFEKGYRR